MKRSNKRWLPLLVFVLLGNAISFAAAAEHADAKALSIAQQAQRLVELKSDTALRTSAEFAERNQLLDDAIALQAQVEGGISKLSSAPQQQLTQAIDRAVTQFFHRSGWL